jgi:predicted esterase
VMAVDLATRASKRYGGAVCLSGAILEPKLVPPAKSETTPIMLIHKVDDDCFSWEERYLPMKNILQQQGYATTCIERPYGGHHISLSDLVTTSEWIAPLLGIKDWRHPIHDEEE